MKKILSIVLSLVVSMVFLAGCTKEESVETNTEKSTAIEAIKKNDKVTIGVFGDKPPFGYVDEKGERQGFDVEIAKRFAKEILGSEDKLELVLVEAANRVAFLEANKVDVILANFTVTPERKEKVDFANPYMKVALGIVSPEDSTIKYVEDLKGKKLIVNKGTTAEMYFVKNHPEIELLKYERNTEAFEALKDGRGAALAHDNTLLFAWAQKTKGFEVGISSLGDEDTIAPAVKKGNEALLNDINNIVDHLTKEGFFKEAYDKTLLPAYGESIKAEDILIQE